MNRRSLLKASAIGFVGANLSFALSRLLASELKTIKIQLQEFDAKCRMYDRLDRFFFKEALKKKSPPTDPARLNLSMAVSIKDELGNTPIGAKVSVSQSDTFKMRKGEAATPQYTAWQKIVDSTPININSHMPRPALKNRQAVNAIDIVVLHEGRWGIARVLLPEKVVNTLKSYDAGQRIGGVTTTTLTDLALKEAGVEKNIDLPSVEPVLTSDGVHLDLQITLSKKNKLNGVSV